jgi:hypothetical protein
MVIWGGTGKSAAFINRYGLDRVRFPIVVDSDPAKVGTFVPGTGQEIRFRDWLKDNPGSIVIIPPQWRALDIVLEIERAGISFKQILIEHHGELIDYFHDSHPYDFGKYGSIAPDAIGNPNTHPFANGDAPPTATRSSIQS